MLQAMRHRETMALACNHLDGHSFYPNFEIMSLPEIE